MGGDARALRDTVARVRRALPGSQYAQYGSSSVLFITSLRNLLLLRQDYREVMRITINQSQLISSARCVTPRRVVSMITKNKLMH